MSLIKDYTITVKQSAESRIDQVDFDNLVFGSVFSDHMFECDYKDGAWHNPTIRPYGPLSIYPSAKVFHYGRLTKMMMGEYFYFVP